MFSQYLKWLFFIFIIFSFTGCGYKPSSKFSRNVLGEKISTSVTISLEDPENTVLIKDSVDRAILETFHASIVDRGSANTHLNVEIQKTWYTPIQYNNDGYVVSYKMNVLLNITREHNHKSKNYLVSGFYDFSVQPNSVVSDLDRFDAIRRGATKAIEAFIAQVSIEDARKQRVGEE